VTAAATTGLIDLHLHSTASDGSRSPTDVVRAAHEVGLVAIALTDHDTVSGSMGAQAAGAALGVRVVNGVELSAVEGESETHVLGLHLGDTSVLERGLGELRAMRGRRAARIVELLAEQGFMAEWSVEGGTVRIAEHNCAVQAVAEKYPELCEAEADFLRDILKTDVQRAAYIPKGCNACEYAVILNGVNREPRPEKI